MTRTQSLSRADVQAYAIRVLAEHGMFTVRIDGDEVQALITWSAKTESGQEWHTVPTDSRRALYEWLGYS